MLLSLSVLLHSFVRACRCVPRCVPRCMLESFCVFESLGCLFWLLFPFFLTYHCLCWWQGLKKLSCVVVSLVTAQRGKHKRVAQTFQEATIEQNTVFSLAVASTKKIFLGVYKCLFFLVLSLDALWFSFFCGVMHDCASAAAPSLSPNRLFFFSWPYFVSLLFPRWCFFSFARRFR